eukprot:s2541_g4.t1
MLWVATEGAVDPAAVQTHAKAIEDLSADLDRWTGYCEAVNHKANLIENRQADDRRGISELQNQVSELEGQVIQLQSEVLELEHGAQKLRTRVVSLEEEMAVLRAMVEQLSKTRS